MAKRQNASAKKKKNEVDQVVLAVGLVSIPFGSPCAQRQIIFGCFKDVWAFDPSGIYLFIKISISANPLTRLFIYPFPEEEEEKKTDL